MRALYILALVGVACDDHAFSGGDGGSDEVVEGDGYSAVQTTLSNNCTSCHGGSFPPLDGDLCSDIVGVASEQLSSMSVVEAGASEESYLYQKLSGTHEDAGGSGSQMPLGGTISSSDLGIIEDWINAGASCDES